MNHVRFSVPFVLDWEIPHIEEKFFEETQILQDGRPVRQLVSKSVKPSSRFKGMTIFDFSLESVIAAGALDSMSPTTLKGGSALSLDGKLESLNGVLELIPSNPQTTDNND